VEAAKVKMSWLITGATGQLGTALQVVLMDRGIEFTALSHDEMDITNPSKVNEHVSASKPSIIVNTAAWTDVDGAETSPDMASAVNAQGALNMALAAKQIGATFAHVSTDYVFSGLSNSPWSENDLRAPQSIYGKTKAAGEVAVLAEYSEGTYLFRTAWLYSKWGKNFAKTMAQIALIGTEEVKVVDDQRGQPTSALDLANQIVATFEARLPFGIYHATNSRHATWFEFAQEIFRLSGADINLVIPVPSTTFPSKATRPSNSVLGHEAWKTVGANNRTVPAMRDWRLALINAMPTIISAVKAEG
jgi:dTDP-4-dehydrorhamnose reductase